MSVYLVDKDEGPPEPSPEQLQGLAGAGHSSPAVPTVPHNISIHLENQLTEGTKLKNERNYKKMYGDFKTTFRFHESRIMKLSPPVLFFSFYFKILKGTFIRSAMTNIQRKEKFPKKEEGGESRRLLHFTQPTNKYNSIV